VVVIPLFQIQCPVYYCNTRFTELLGYALEDLPFYIHNRAWTMYPQCEVPEVFKVLKPTLLARLTTFTTATTLLHKRGSWLTATVSHELIYAGCCPLWLILKIRRGGRVRSGPLEAR